MKVIVDSSILIDYLHGGIQWEEFLLAASPSIELYISTVVVMEIFAGQSSRKAENTKKIYDLLDNFQKVELTTDIAESAGKIYRDAKQPHQIADYIIAASALDINATVLTLNAKHFESIPGIKLY